MSTQMSADYVSQHFTNYMFDNVAEPHRRHVQRVAAWIGQIVNAIDAVKDEWTFWHSRQLCYRVGKQWYKVRYAHSIGARGGIEIVEMEDGRTDGEVIEQLTDLKDVENFYIDFCFGRKRKRAA